MAPSEPNPIQGFLPIDADPELVQQEIDLGYKDGATAAKNELEKQGHPTLEETLVKILEQHR